MVLENGPAGSSAPRRAGSVALLLAFATSALLPIGLAEPPRGPHAAEFEYGLGSAATGTIDGSCRAAAAMFAVGVPGAFRFASGSGTLEEYETNWNTSVVMPESGNPIIVPHEAQQRRVATLALPAGDSALDWDAEGRVRAFGTGWPGNDTLPAVEPFGAEIQAGGLRSQPPGWAADAGQYYVERDGSVQTTQGGVAGWHRIVEARNGTTVLRGDLTFYLEAARVTDASGRTHQLPPAHSTTTVQETPVAVHQEHTHRHALLRLAGAIVPLEAERAALVCSNLSAIMQGTLLVHAARGRLHAEDQSVAFGPIDLSLTGAFDLSESFTEPEPGSRPRVHGTVSGHFTAVGFDFQRTDFPGRGPVVAGAVVGSLAVAGLLIAIGWRLYTRLRTPDLLGQRTRNLIHEAVRANPWASVTQIQHATDLPRSTVRYQLAVLGRHGLVRTDSREPSPRFAVAEEPEGAPRPFDLVLRTLRDRLAPGPLRLAEAMRVLMERHDYSRFGAWKAIHRATQADVVQLERADRQVWVRWRP